MRLSVEQLDVPVRLLDSDIKFAQFLRHLISLRPQLANRQGGQHLQLRPQLPRVAVLARARGGIPDEIPEVTVHGAPMGIGALLKSAGLVPSNGEGLRKVEQGGVPEKFSVIMSLDGKRARLEVIAASGMCAGGRVMNYLKAMLHDERHDVLYVESLIGEQTVNTVPDATLLAFRDHGEAAATLAADPAGARAVLAAVAAAGVDLEAVGERLQVDGLKLFDDAFAALLALTA